MCNISDGRGTSIRPSLSLPPRLIFIEKWPEIFPGFLSIKKRVWEMGNDNSTLHSGANKVMACFPQLCQFFNTKECLLWETAVLTENNNDNSPLLSMCLAYMNTLNSHSDYRRCCYHPNVKIWKVRHSVIKWSAKVTQQEMVGLEFQPRKAGARAWAHNRH